MYVYERERDTYMHKEREREKYFFESMLAKPAVTSFQERESEKKR